MIDLDTLNIEDDQRTESAEEFFNDEAADFESNAIIIMGQLDPMERDSEGKLRWSPEQIAIIEKAAATLDTWTE